jgi:hypothetical protein
MRGTSAQKRLEETRGFIDPQLDHFDRVAAQANRHSPFAFDT